MNIFKVLCTILNCMFIYGVNSLTSDVFALFLIIVPFVIVCTLCFVNIEMIIERK